MSWLFSQALVEEFSEGSSWDGEPYAQLNVMPTRHKFWRNDKMMEFSKLSQFGLTCAALTESRGRSLLMWFLRGSLANRTRTQEVEGGLMMRGGFGKTLRESCPKRKQNSSGLRTCQESFQMGLDFRLLKTLPKWGSIWNGVFYQQQPLEQSMYEKGYGYLPTPTAHNSKEGAYPAEYSRKTPTLATHAGGKINPMWTEHLMGLPISWTDLKPLAMDKFQEWMRQHSDCLQVEFCHDMQIMPPNTTTNRKL